MDPDIQTALREFQEDIQDVINKEVHDLVLELEVADIELLHGKLTESGE